jgi:hypothetical protein
LFRWTASCATSIRWRTRSSARNTARTGLASTWIHQSYNRAWSPGEISPGRVTRPG